MRFCKPDALCAAGLGSKMLERFEPSKQKLEVAIAARWMRKPASLSRSRALAQVEVKSLKADTEAEATGRAESRRSFDWVRPFRLGRRSCAHWRNSGNAVSFSERSDVGLC